MNKYKRNTIIGLLTTIIFSADVHATILFENAWSDEIGANCSFECESTVGAENFVLAQSSTVESLTFGAWTRKSSDISGLSVNWSIWNDGGSTPSGSALYSGTVEPVLNNLGVVQSNNDFDRVEYVLDVADFSLDAGTFWVSFEVDLTTAASAIYWAYTTDGDVDKASKRSNRDWTPYYGAYGNRDDGQVFSVLGTSTIPEPTSIALLGLGLAGIGWRRKVKAKR